MLEKTKKRVNLDFRLKKLKETILGLKICLVSLYSDMVRLLLFNLDNNHHKFWIGNLGKIEKKIFWLIQSLTQKELITFTWGVYLHIRQFLPRLRYPTSHSDDT